MFPVNQMTGMQLANELFNKKDTVVDDQRAVDFLAESVEDSSSIIENGIKGYVLEGQESAYRIVATELRKLLLDRNAVSSFKKSISRAKNARCLLELHFGNGRKIFLRSFGAVRPAGLGDFGDVTPSVYMEREDIIYAAANEGKPTSLHEWLKEDLAFVSKGQIWNVHTALGHMAGREGSHIINPVGDAREARVDVAITFLSEVPKPEEMPTIDFNQYNPWRQFVIEAGMRLLCASFPSGNQLFEHNIDIPAVRLNPQALRIQSRLTAS